MLGFTSILPAFCDVLLLKNFNFSATVCLFLGIVDIFYSIKGQGGNFHNICTRHFVIIPILCQFWKSIRTRRAFAFG